MKKEYHILNGDALKEQFPVAISGEKIIARECLVDGDVKGNNLAEFYETRAQFLSQHYGESEEDYFKKAVSEFERIQQIEEGASIHLWFEDDLFCQVNFWFVSYLLSKSLSKYNVYLVRPKVHNKYGFGGLNQSQLMECYEEKIPLTKLNEIAMLWLKYQKEDSSGLLHSTESIADIYPFILPAVKAHIDRIPSKDNMGRPKASLLAIMNDLKTNEFGPVFQLFNERESIYGFGDLQVKRMFDEIKNLKK